MKPSLQVVLKDAFPFILKIITILAILAMETSIPELKLEFALKLNKNYSMFLQLIPGECVAHILHSTSFCRYGTDTYLMVEKQAILTPSECSFS